MTPIPAACTTAAAVRRRALEPTMNTIARNARIKGLLVELMVLLNESEADLHEVCGQLDTAARRLDYAEQAGSYNAVEIVSEVPNARHIAARINTAIDTLTAPAHKQDQDAAHNDLDAIFETFGTDLFEQRFTYHVGQKRLLTLKGLFDRWLAEHNDSAWGTAA